MVKMFMCLKVPVYLGDTWYDITEGFGVDMSII